jgi:hypothetical protein
MVAEGKILEADGEAAIKDEQQAQLPKSEWELFI